MQRTPLCSVKDCPAPKDPDWHVPHCGHGLAGEHQHFPKRSQGGKEVVAFLCHDCHMETDNGLWHDGVYDLWGERHYYIKDIKGNDLLDIIIGASTGADMTPQEVAPSAEATNLIGPGVSPPEGRTAKSPPGPDNDLPVGEVGRSHRPFLEMDFEEWRSYGRVLADNLNACRWDIGCWLLDGEAKWGELYTQAEAETGLDYSTLSSYRSVVKAYRQANLLPQATTSFSVLSVLAPVVRRDAENGERLLLAAEQLSWTGEEARREVKALTGVIEPEYDTCNLGYQHRKG